MEANFWGGCRAPSAATGLLLVLKDTPHHMIPVLEQSMILVCGLICAE